MVYYHTGVLAPLILSVWDYLPLKDHATFREKKPKKKPNQKVSYFIVLFIDEISEIVQRNIK